MAHLLVASEDVGIPPSVKWELPRGVSAGPLVSLLLKRVMMGKSGHTVIRKNSFPVQEVSFSDEFEEVERFAIKGKAAWLACSRTCLPGYTDLEIEIPLGSQNLQDEEWSKDLKPFVPNYRSILQRVGFPKQKHSMNLASFVWWFLQKKGVFSQDFIFFGEGRTLRSNALQPVSQKPGKWELQLTRSDWSPKMNPVSVVYCTEKMVGAAIRIANFTESTCLFCEITCKGFLSLTFPRVFVSPRYSSLSLSRSG